MLLLLHYTHWRRRKR